MTVRDRAYGARLGPAIGDALGMPGSIEARGVEPAPDGERVSAGLYAAFGLRPAAKPAPVPAGGPVVRPAGGPVAGTAGRPVAGTAGLAGGARHAGADR
ncbi:hypothetical protein GCM10023322_43110 [Rugosimonospora acidiphila]|uniref:Uncharacterized protein n=1 Tax=Rugosimonospora acidiphila TaxID=556531 RepID=A0ABP9S2G9_9ACTN